MEHQRQTYAFKVNKNISCFKPTSFKLALNKLMTKRLAFEVNRYLHTLIIYCRVFLVILQFEINARDDDWFQLAYISIS